MAVTANRKIVWNILAAVHRGRRLDRSFEDHTKGLEKRERAWCRRVSYGIQRFRGRIDYLLDLHTSRCLSDVDPAVLDVLRIGLYETFYMDGIPQYAAVSQAVELAKKVGHSSTGFVNAVLRSVARKGVGQENFPDGDTDPLAFLSTWGSHPDWLIERWLSRWSVEEVRSLVNANNEVPPIFLNCLGRDLVEAVSELDRRGIKAKGIKGTSCVMLRTSNRLEEAMKVLPCIVQDPAAALVPAFMNVQDHEYVVDLCAAPGGKAIALAAKGHPVLAADRSFSRLGLLKRSLDRLAESTSVDPLLRIQIAQGDVHKPLIAETRAMLIDVPCTGTGTLRRNPDIRWKITEKKLHQMSERQTEILDDVAGVVSVGGTLVYSTCSLELEENKNQVERFLLRYPHFQMDPGKGVDGKFLDSQGHLHVLPHRFGFDGSFAARMRRVS